MDDASAPMDVSSWLASLPGSISQYALTFRARGFDTMRAVYRMNGGDLEAMAVKPFHARIIMNAIDAL